ncbi:hypothetical protein GbCGDNIH4_7004 [Granulibacter bethesdensis CGDNIH4]|nr:hypothetical protein GbCGDNIH4_7004 [Granulibacter bethesdensis CGDNIH4]
MKSNSFLVRLSRYQAAVGNKKERSFCTKNDFGVGLDGTGY